MTQGLFGNWYTQTAQDRQQAYNATEESYRQAQAAATAAASTPATGGTNMSVSAPPRRTLNPDRPPNPAAQATAESQVAAQNPSNNPLIGQPANAADAAGTRGRVDAGTAQTANDLNTFDPSNPTRALTNALRQSGINAGSMNPVMKTIMSMAPGLATAFLTRGAMGNYGDVSGTNTGALFGQFLRSAISGGGGNGVADATRGGLAATIRNPFGTANGHSALVDAHGAIQNALDQEATPGGKPNEFALALRNMIANSSDGGAGMIASMQTPFMNNQMARAYGDSMTRRADYAANDVDYTNPRDDMFAYLLGIGR